MAECTEKGKQSGSRNGNGKGKGFGRVYALRCEDLPTIDTLAGTLLVSAHDAYCLVDTGATHACISETFMSVCGLSACCISDMSLYVNTPLSSGTVLDRICKDVDVLISGFHMPVDMFVLPLSDFDVILGMNWLNKYRAKIDCASAILNFNLEDNEVSISLMSERPRSMMSMELWEKPHLSALSVEEEELQVEMVPIVREYSDVFLDDLPSLPLDRELSLGSILCLVLHQSLREHTGWRRQS